MPRDDYENLTRNNAGWWQRDMKKIVDQKKTKSSFAKSKDGKDVANEIVQFILASGEPAATANDPTMSGAMTLKISQEISKRFGIDVSPDDVNGVLNSGMKGYDSDYIARGLRTDLGMAQQSPITDVPGSDGFWNQFMYEWKEARANIKANDAFRKEKLQPAFETYRDRLSGLSNEAGFSPINLKMGDFETSFMPNRAVSNAGNILNSQLAETDVMQPKRAEIDYLAQLGDVARWKETMKANKNAVQQSQEDQGSWLDVISDTIGIGKSGVDLYKSFKGL